MIGSAVVQPDGQWVFLGKSRASPGILPGVDAESGNGIREPVVPLRLR
jgi:hypothetical protein